MRLHESDSALGSGSLGVPILRQIWSKYVSNQPLLNSPLNFELERSVFDMLGINFRDAYEFLLSTHPTFDEFEQWCLSIVDAPCPMNVDRLNAHTANLPISSKLQSRFDEVTRMPDVLSADDLSFWHEHGYVIVRQAISKEACEATKALICDYIGADLNDPLSWSQVRNTQGIWVSLKYHAQLTQNRLSPRIKKAFSQLWRSADIFPSVDQCGFNPPVSNKMLYRGQPIHLDVDFTKPCEFATQGILYLTDTTEKQGALSVVPGFHKTFSQWLAKTQELDPRKLQDFQEYQTKPIAANAGDFIIWHHHLPHSSSPNYESTPRITQFINYLPLPKMKCPPRSA